MQLSSGEPTGDPLARFRADWRLKARKVKNTWDSGTAPIETAMESTFFDGVKFAAEFLEDEGQAELAIKLQARVHRKV